jgi:hypothetical protein
MLEYNFLFVYFERYYKKLIFIDYYKYFHSNLNIFIFYKRKMKYIPINNF